MILQLAENHGYNDRGIKSFSGLLGVDISFETFALLSTKIEMWVVMPENPELNTIYVAHPGGF